MINKFISQMMVYLTQMVTKDTGLFSKIELPTRPLSQSVRKISTDAQRNLR